MDTDHIFMCGIMWCHYGEMEAGKELIRALSCPDLDTRVLAVMLLQRDPSVLEPN